MLENNGVFKGETVIDGIKIKIEGYLVIRNISISKQQETNKTNKGE